MTDIEEVEALGVKGYRDAVERMATWKTALDNATAHTRSLFDRAWEHKSKQTVGTERLVADLIDEGLASWAKMSPLLKFAAFTRMVGGSGMDVARCRFYHGLLAKDFLACYEETPKPCGCTGKHNCDECVVITVCK